MLGGEEGNININILLFPFSIGRVHFGAPITTGALLNIKYMMYNNTHNTRRPMMHALQVLATYMHNTINISTKIQNGYFFRTKFASPSECKCDCDALIFNQIGHESSELH